MKKKTPIYYDGEIDLIPILKIIWSGKIKILLFTIISLLIGFGYNYQLPNTYSYSLIIEKNNSSEIEKNSSFLLNLNKYETSGKEYVFDVSDKEYVFDVSEKFIYELKDYEEFIIALKNTKKFKENISKLHLTEQKKILSNYTNFLKIEKINNSNINLKLEWHDSEEIIEILKDTINFSLRNLEKSIIKELDEIFEMKKISDLREKSRRLEYLKQQIWIAKELNISDSQITSLDLYGNSNWDYVPYFLIGYKAIGKEIESIEKNFFQNYETQTLEKIISSIKEKTDLKIFNTYSSSLKLLKKTKLILIISILAGLIIGIFYVVIPNVTKSKIFSRKK